MKDPILNCVCCGKKYTWDAAVFLDAPSDEEKIKIMLCHACQQSDLPNNHQKMVREVSEGLTASRNS